MVRTSILVLLGGTWGAVSLGFLRTKLYLPDGGINWGAAVLMLPASVAHLILSPLAKLPSVYLALVLGLTVVFGIGLGLLADMGLDRLFRRGRARPARP